MSYSQQDPESIQNLFDSIAPQYDNGNAILSFNLHRIWNKRLAKAIAPKAQDGNFLDLCAGTGDIAYTLNSLGVQTKATTLLDFSAQMLEVAKTKCPKNLSPSYLVADACQIPLKDESLDAVTIAYGIRNVSNSTTCFQEIFRCLKPKGRLAILELTRPSNPLIRTGHRLYLSTLLPLIGRLLAKNQAAYSYLASSINSFPSPKNLASNLQQVGFQNPSITPLLFGTATLITADKT